MKRFYIADWHYDHANVISFDNRPFSDVEEMNKELIKRWNAAVSKEDVVYVLGDMFWKVPKENIDVLKKLSGQKFLIAGNHDSVKHEPFIKEFVKVVDYLEVDDEGRNIVLCHYPIPCFNKHYYGQFHLYGHVHNSYEYNMMENIRRQMKDLYDKPCNMYNVGCMMPYMNYTPRTLDEIIQ